MGSVGRANILFFTNVLRYVFYEIQMKDEKLHHFIVS